MIKNDPHPAMGPCRTPLYFCFGSALMVLSVFLMPNYARELAGGGAGGVGDPPVPPLNVTMMDSTNSSTKPTLLLHPGPHKTATTFIQCMLTNMMDTLALDNYVYFGRHQIKCLKNQTALDRAALAALRPFPDFLFKKSEMEGGLSNMAVFDPMFLNEMREMHSQGKNAIISNEGFSQFTPEQTKLLIDEFSSNWNVKLILSYRRAYEVLPSVYNQRKKPMKATSDPSLKLWPGETNEYGLVGKPLLPFDIKNKNYYAKKPSGWEFLKQKYPFPDLNIIKLHELDYTGKSGDPILQEMFCHIVSDSMPHSCAAVQLDETFSFIVTSNSYYSFNYDMLATAAYEKQLFGFQKKNEVTPTRANVVQKIQHYQEDTLNLTFNDFDTICLAKEKMDWILNLTIADEKLMYGSNWTSQHEDNIRQAFLDYQVKRPYIYCWIATEKTLQDPTWLAFFDSM